MKVAMKMIRLTVSSWLPILCFFYLPNTFWGICLKILAGVFLISFIYTFTLGSGLNMVGSAGMGFIMNFIWFTIINLHPPQWIGFVLWLLILTGLGTCFKVMKKIEEDPSYDGMKLYDKDEMD